MILNTKAASVQFTFSMFMFFSSPPSSKWKIYLLVSLDQGSVPTSFVGFVPSEGSAAITDRKAVAVGQG